ncbi:prepilin peptidase-dependent protein [Erwinia phyllosphaerae]|uniref:prepilin peptidase-dependent protein n=1 Tax=Erwinia phyllosphaerae TaxID=2853256 RepID=UPI001FEDDCC7|nr:prepilin peptidase-dependent protein [Erwinia phyllosphaerae]MBV4367346.1 prepilin peptidase-dependent protein [Erwinia phyllosphaerae]
MRCLSIKSAGFTLPEMMIALAIGGVLMLGAARFLPLLQMNNLRMLMTFQLREELQLMMATLAKNVRRAGYCHGECQGKALITSSNGQCLLLRWDENSNGKWENADSETSDYYGFRLRNGSLEAQRGVDSCESSGWEKMNDPASVIISDFRVVRKAQQVQLRLSGYALGFPLQALTVERWVTGENL